MVNEQGLVILGIDPGSRVAGFGLVQVVDKDLRYLTHGVLRTPSNVPFAGRLVSLKSQIRELVGQHQPDIAVVERVFLGKNADSAFKLGHARGVCLAELCENGAKVVEYAARQVKKGVTGSGAATKEQVALVLGSIFRLKSLPLAGGQETNDATDALALAYYHGTQLQVVERLAMAQRRERERGV